MTAVSIRNLDDAVGEKLRIRAASHGRSMEAEMRAILIEAVQQPDESEDFINSLIDRFSQLGGVDLDLPTRSSPLRDIDFAA